MLPEPTVWSVKVERLVGAMSATLLFVGQFVSSGHAKWEHRLAIISPYAQQVHLLRRTIKALLGISEGKSCPVDVNTVDGFQVTSGAIARESLDPWPGSGSYEASLSPQAIIRSSAAILLWHARRAVCLAVAVGSESDFDSVLVAS